jgi:peptide/nickel transport system permease protein
MADATDNTVQAERARSRIAMAWDSDVAHAFRHSPVAMISAAVTLILVLSAVFAPLIAPHDPFNPATLNLMNGFTPPGEANAFTGESFWLGTDDQGRDVFSTILYGLRISLFVGFAAVALALVLGVTLGLIAGYVGGWVETVIMRVADVQLTFPAILVAMLIFGIAKGITPPEYRDQMAIWVLILAIGLSDWVQFARVVRGATLVEKSKEYVQAARLIGRSPFRDHVAAYPAQRAVAGAGDRDDLAGLGDHRGGDAELPRRGRAADGAVAWARSSGSGRGSCSRASGGSCSSRPVCC